MPTYDLAVEIAAQLSASGFGDLYSGTSPKIFVGEEPAEPLEAITVLNATGGRTTSLLGEEHIFEVRVRSADDPDVRGGYETASTTARQIWASLTENGTGGQGSFGGIGIAKLSSNSPAVSLGRGEGPHGGTWRVSQFYTALIKAASFTGS